jgi:hypothetical protein
VRPVEGHGVGQSAGERAQVRDRRLVNERAVQRIERGQRRLADRPRDVIVRHRDESNAESVRKQEAAWEHDERFDERDIEIEARMTSMKVSSDSM